jgi:hypothetical protein
VPDSLDAFFPAGSFLAPRVWETAARWFPSDRHTVEFVTGHALSCAGAMPVVCHRATLSPSGLAAMADSGIDIAPDLLAYSTPDEYRRHVRSLASRSMRAVTPFWTPPDVVPAAATWIDPSLLQFLNNKSNMAELVPAGSLPRRETGQLAATLASMRMPCVVKVGTDMPNGGGSDMMICRNARDRSRALRRFATGEGLVVEEFLRIAQNYCVQLALPPEGSIVHIGSTSQICLANGAHAGNLLDPRNPPPAAVLKLGEQIALEGRRRGYTGIAGFDIVVTEDGRVLAIDLNFRLVSSTAQALLHRRLSEARGLALSRLAFSSHGGTLDEMLTVSRRGIDEGWLVPLATFDPAFGGLPEGGARCRFLIFGNSAAEIDAREKELLARGIAIAGRGVSRWMKAAALARGLWSRARR